MSNINRPEVNITRPMKKDKGAPKQRRSILTRTTLIKAAADVLETKGYADFTMRDIAKSASLGLGTVYGHFAGKRELIGALLTERFELKTKLFKQVYESMSPEADLHDFLTTYLEQSRKVRFGSRLDQELLSAAETIPEMREILLQHELMTRSIYARALAQAGSKWHLDQLEAAASYMLTVIESIEKKMLNTKNNEDRELFSMLLKSTVTGLVRAVLKSDSPEHFRPEKRL
jgi:AcrR family transcriptional regulator